MSANQPVALFDSTNHISFDAYCGECGQNLRGLPRSGNCPECGTPAMWSLRGGGAATRGDARVIRQLYHGAALLAWVILWSWLPIVWPAIWIALWQLAIRRGAGESGTASPFNPMRLLLVVLPATCTVLAVPQLFVYWPARAGMITISLLDGFVLSILAIGMMHVLLSVVCICGVAWREFNAFNRGLLILATAFAGGATVCGGGAAAALAGTMSLSNIELTVACAMMLGIPAILMLWRAALVVADRLDGARRDLRAIEGVRYAWQRSVPGHSSSTSHGPA
ncbi:MAG: hypothetical protein ACKVS9_09415 [Phycisphaerae bacterium]